MPPGTRGLGSSSYPGAPGPRGRHRGRRLPVLGGQAESASSALQSGQGPPKLDWPAATRPSSKDSANESWAAKGSRADHRATQKRPKTPNTQQGRQRPQNVHQAEEATLQRPTPAGATGGQDPSITGSSPTASAEIPGVCTQCATKSQTADQKGRGRGRAERRCKHHRGRPTATRWARARFT